MAMKKFEEWAQENQEDIVQEGVLSRAGRMLKGALGSGPFQRLNIVFDRLKNQDPNAPVDHKALALELQGALETFLAAANVKPEDVNQIMQQLVAKKGMIKQALKNVP